MTRRIGDRRTRARFEIVGDLWGTIDASATLVVRNLGQHGALVESPVPLPPDSVHVVSAVVDGDPHPLQLVVRRSVRDEDARQPQYLTGVEFVNLTPAVEAFILRCLGEGSSAPMEKV